MKKIITLLLIIMLLYLSSCEKINKTSTPSTTAKDAPSSADTPITHPGNQNTENNTGEPATTTEKAPASIEKSSETEEILNDDGKLIGKIYYSLLSITVNDTESIGRKISTEFENIIDTLITKYKTRCLFASLDYEPDSDDIYSFMISPNAYFSGNYISFYITTTIEFGKEAEKEVYTYTYSLSDGSMKTINDIGINLTVLAGEAIDSSLSMNISFFDDYRDIINNKTYSLWYLDRENIVLVYTSAVLAPGIYGIIEIPVSLKNL